MILLLTGASSTGKTFIAPKILERYKIPYYSIDHLKMGLFRGDPKCNFNPTDDNQFIAECLAPYLEGIIRTAMENNQNLIVEGCYFEGKSIKRMRKEYPDQFINICLVMSENYCHKNFHSNVINHRNIIETRAFKEDRTLEQFISENQKFASFSKEAAFEVFEIEDQFEKMINKLFSLLDLKLPSSTSIVANLDRLC